MNVYGIDIDKQKILYLKKGKHILSQSKPETLNILKTTKIELAIIIN